MQHKWDRHIALLIAREVVKDKLRAKGVKIHTIEAGEYTRAAQQLVDERPIYLNLAETLAILQTLPNEKVSEIKAMALKVADEHGVKAK